MQIPGYKVRITPQCVKNHGAENRVDYAFSLLRDRIIKSLSVYPDSTVEITYNIVEKPAPSRMVGGCADVGV